MVSRETMEKMVLDLHVGYVGSRSVNRTLWSDLAESMRAYLAEQEKVWIASPAACWVPGAPSSPTYHRVSTDKVRNWVARLEAETTTEQKAVYLEEWVQLVRAGRFLP